MQGRGLKIKSKVLVETIDGEVLLGRKSAGGRYNKLFKEHADVTTISHVHAPNLGAWAQNPSYVTDSLCACSALSFV